MELGERVAKLSNENFSLKEKFQKVEEQTHSLNSKILKLEQSNESLKEKHRSEVNNFKLKIESTDQKIKVFTQREAQLQYELTKKERKINEIEEKLKREIKPLLQKTGLESFELSFTKGLNYSYALKPSVLLNKMHGESNANSNVSNVNSNSNNNNTIMNYNNTVTVDDNSNKRLLELLETNKAGYINKINTLELNLKKYSENFAIYVNSLKPSYYEIKDFVYNFLYKNNLCLNNKFEIIWGNYDYSTNTNTSNRVNINNTLDNSNNSVISYDNSNNLNLNKDNATTTTNPNTSIVDNTNNTIPESSKKEFFAFIDKTTNNYFSFEENDTVYDLEIERFENILTSQQNNLLKLSQLLKLLDEGLIYISKTTGSEYISQIKKILMTYKEGTNCANEILASIVVSQHWKPQENLIDQLKVKTLVLDKLINDKDKDNDRNKLNNSFSTGNYLLNNEGKNNYSNANVNDSNNSFNVNSIKDLGSTESYNSLFDNKVVEELKHFENLLLMLKEVNYTAI